jgi:transcriptional regulator with XRE-family HTH domain
MEFNPDCEEFGTLLADYRFAKEKNLEVLAKELHVGRATLSRWENNQISKTLTLDVVYRIAEVLEIGGTPFNPDAPEVVRFIIAFACLQWKHNAKKDSGFWEWIKKRF